MQVRKHLPAAPVAPAATPPATQVWVGSSPTLAKAGEPSTRDLSLEVSDTAEGRIELVNYGRFRVGCGLVHGDIVSGKLEVVAHAGAGPLSAIDYVWVNDKLVYPGAPPTGVEVEVRLGGSIIAGALSFEQAAFTIISNSTIASMQHPGQALVAVRVNLTTSVAIVSGNMPKVEAAGRGLLMVSALAHTMYPPASPVYGFTENPIWHLVDALSRQQYGAGIPLAGLNMLETPIGGSSIELAAWACDSIITYENFSPIGQQNSNQYLLCSTYLRNQSFKAPAITFRIEARIRAVADGWINPLLFRVRTSPSGTDIEPTDTSGLLSVLAGQDYTIWAEWTGDHGFEKGQTLYFVILNTGWAVNMQWHHNSLTNAYPDGKAQYYGGSWIDINYDHWFRAYEAEQTFRCALTVSERTPIEQVAETILRTCNGRIGWWDGLYRVFLDGEATVAGTISDKASDAPDLLIVGGTLKVGRSEGEVANVGVGSFYDVQTWTRPEVKYQADAVKAGTEQEKILRQDAAVPSGGQLYRLLGTQVKRGARTWRGSCAVAQKGIRFAPGDLLTMSCSLFAGTKTVIIDDMRDAAGGTFELSLLEWAASDFVEEPYVAQAVVATTTTT